MLGTKSTRRRRPFGSLLLSTEESVSADLALSPSPDDEGASAPLPSAPSFAQRFLARTREPDHEILGASPVASSRWEAQPGPRTPPPMKAS